MSTDQPFNPLEASAYLRANARGRGGPRLTRTAQCQAFALLQSGVAQRHVAQIFSVSQGTMSQLANCLGRAPDLIWRYRDVMNEWNRLGREKFISTYLTEENSLKAKKLQYGVADGPREPDSPSNPRADGCSYAIIGPFEVGNWTARIDWAPCSPDIAAELRGPDGWRWADVSTCPLEYHGRMPWDEPIREDGMYMPFRTSGDAFDHVFISNGLRSPRRGGRPKKG